MRRRGSTGTGRQPNAPAVPEIVSISDVKLMEQLMSNGFDGAGLDRRGGPCRLPECRCKSQGARPRSRPLSGARGQDVTVLTTGGCPRDRLRRICSDAEEAKRNSDAHGGLELPGPLRERFIWRYDQYWSALMISPPARVTSEAINWTDATSLIKWTDPSTNRALAPPGWNE
jgi:hypothetical protein